MMPAVHDLCELPGVTGAALIDHDLKPLSNIDRTLFPQGTESIIFDMMEGIGDETGAIKQINLSFQNGKIVARTYDGGIVLVRCEPSLNLQMLNLSLAQTLRKMAGAAPSLPAAVADTVAPTSPAVTGEMELQIEVIEKTAGTFWESMTESVAMTKTVAIAVGNACGTGPFRRIALRSAAGKKKVFPVRLIQEPQQGSLDDKLLVTLAVAESLGVTTGDLIVAQSARGQGIFGWEGV